MIQFKDALGLVKFKVSYKILKIIKYNYLFNNNKIKQIF